MARNYLGVLESRALRSQAVKRNRDTVSPDTPFDAHFDEVPSASVGVRGPERDDAKQHEDFSRHPVPEYDWNTMPPFECDIVKLLESRWFGAHSEECEDASVDGWYRPSEFASYEPDAGYDAEESHREIYECDLAGGPLPALPASDEVTSHGLPINAGQPPPSWLGSSTGISQNYLRSRLSSSDLGNGKGVPSVEEPDVGTWRDRQVRLLSATDTLPEVPDTSSTAEVGPGGLSSLLSPVVAGPEHVRDHSAQGATGRTDDHRCSEERAEGMVWRYRFTRKWMAAQAEPLNQSHSHESQMLEEMLVEAGGTAGWHLQFGRANGAPMGSNHTHDLQSAGTSLGTLDSGLLADYDKMESMRRMKAAVERAGDLIEHQRRIEQEVSHKWEKAEGLQSEWGGARVPPVQIDSWGTFEFVVVRLFDPTGRSMLCVRGRNQSNADATLKEFVLQIHHECLRHKLTQAPTEEVGRGVMKWRSEADRHVVVLGSQTRVASQDMTAADVSRLAAAICQHSLLSMHCRVTVADA